jgi:hypothetical protein
VLKFLLEPVFSPDYDVVRADNVAAPGMITSQVVDYVVDADLVIADLTDWNPNVFYELAVRHITRKPLIQIMLSGQRLPFDVHAMRTTFYDLTDPFRIEETKRELTEVRAAVEGGELIESPISAAVDLKELRASGDAMQRAVADLTESLAELRAEVRASASGAYATVSPAVLTTNSGWRPSTGITLSGSSYAPFDNTGRVVRPTTGGTYYFEPPTIITEEPETRSEEDGAEQGETEP